MWLPAAVVTHAHTASATLGQGHGDCPRTLPLPVWFARSHMSPGTQSKKPRMRLNAELSAHGSRSHSCPSCCGEWGFALALCTCECPLPRAMRLHMCEGLGGASDVSEGLLLALARLQLLCSWVELRKTELGRP